MKEADEYIYDRSDDPAVLRNQLQLRKQLVLGVASLLVIGVFLEILVFFSYRTIWSGIPFLNQIALHLAIALLIALGIYIGIVRYRSATIPPRINQEALVFGQREQYSLISIRELKLSADGKWLTLEFDRTLRRWPRRLAIRLGEPLVPGPEHFVAVLKTVWEAARVGGASRPAIDSDD